MYFAPNHRTPRRMTFKHVLEKYRKYAFSERDKGSRFERLMKAYLLTDPKWMAKFKEVWLWEDFPGRRDLGGGDTGIDLVARTHGGDYWAIQCKCYDEKTSIDKAAVDSFLSTSSRTFLNAQMQTTGFAHRLWISTTHNFTSNAEEAFKNQQPPVTRIGLMELVEAPVDWEKLENGVHGEAARTPRKTLRDHQVEARTKTHEHFKSHDRGKLIMACGTGKTFTALRIAENETNSEGLILFLVPSIALLGQTLREWSADALERINAIAICSDPAITKQKQKNDNDSFSVVDLAYPASTNADYILHQFEEIKKQELPGMTVVFSTYQSIEVVARAQQVLLKNGYPEFDLIICDEAHRTTGVTLSGEDESAFVKVHDENFIHAKKRLYMTATPRLFSDDTKSKAAQEEVVLCSMDDPKLYGEEIYRIGFGEAVERQLLTDYKVLVLTLSDQDVPPAVQRMLSDGEHEIETDDLSKIIGSINALSKQFMGDDGVTKEADPHPMKRAVAFCANIPTSKKISAIYNTAGETYLNELPPEKQAQMVSTEAKHIDGTMAAPQRDQLLSWLKEDTPENQCRIITNVRVLSEGVDVPSLDAVLFLSARNSQVDVVQSVGRVMRRSPGKKYGYIVIPVVVPSTVEPEIALNDNERYKVVWTVLNALRAHDDRFNAIVNKIELNKRKPSNVLVGRPEVSYDSNGKPFQLDDDQIAYEDTKDIRRQLSLHFEDLQQVVYARMVKKVGSRQYWEQWAKDVAIIAERQVERIGYLIENRKDQREAFLRFLDGLQKNINPSINEAQAIDMLAQHIITQPVFNALFEGYSFAENNPVSAAMQQMLNALEDGSNLAEQDENLQKFYDSVRKRAEGIDNADGKQRIIIELYDHFFKAAFPKLVEQLGIVYTPLEVVDFIIHSVDDVLKREFGRSMSDENVHILDPFTGTGTFITRILQSGLIRPDDLARKYAQELHANELVLLAYYIAAVNIENAYHDQLQAADGASGDTAQAYTPFEGIVLTDTFQLGESDAGEKLYSDMFPQNSARVARQRKAPVQVILGNPPYSVGQSSANDNAQNQKYERLDSRIANTYAQRSTATNKNSLYDSYIKAFRWSTDRLDQHGGSGVIAFVSNGAWIDSNSTDGFRKMLEAEFSSIYVFNLRGNQRTSGETSRKEGGKIFGSGSRTPIAVTLLIKRAKTDKEKAVIYYHDIGDYLSREEKLAKVLDFRSVGNPKMPWKVLQPNAHGDWIGQRNELFGTFIPLEPKKKFEQHPESFFIVNSRGAETGRDVWSYNSSETVLSSNIEASINFYNDQRVAFHSKHKGKAKDHLDYNTECISWTSSLIQSLEKKTEIAYNPRSIRTAVYRPYFKQNFYFNSALVHRMGQHELFFPTPSHENRVICVSGLGGTKPNSSFITDLVPDLNMLDAGTQCFPLYYYEESTTTNPSLFDTDAGDQYTRRDGISDFILQRAVKQYGARVSKEDIFYYVYGFLHSPSYRTAFANDLKKMLPRLPLVEDVRDFWKFSKAGRALADLHIGYESVPPYPGVEVTGAESEFFRVEKMRFPKKDRKDTIHYNSVITISNIPAKAYDYVVNGKSAIEWIMERYQVKKDKKSGIINDPNDWAKEVGNPRYILDLLLSVINVSAQTVEVVEGLGDGELVSKT